MDQQRNRAAFYQNDFDPELLKLYNNKLFQSLDWDEYKTVIDKTSPFGLNYQADDIIIHQGYETNNIGVLLKGTIISEKYHIDGRRQIIQNYSKNDLLCIEAVQSRHGTSPVTMVAKSDCRIIWISYTATFKSQLLTPEIRFKLMEQILHQMSDENIKLMYKNDVLAHRKLRDRIITYLSIISEKRQSSQICIRMTQLEFADYLCVDRSALSHELNLMRAEGLISYHRDYYTVHIKPE